ncbi:MAG TPA: ferredoxin [Paenalcaligenes hominis]|uniref:Ferredoxin n=1 Tax=Paenalcaligenes hominis TaxID=643674 RepID=A0A1U9K0L4_9BURK|nr:ferredoxin [Paenalcaligenes hominis]AQS51580.1 ferredoxin [Paenalcaligenes hominis]NJB65321.1 hypothetical protein [Paenalcaligenes hominis]GGE72716.1 hypothetical protein GCM10007278_21180 [Paenalcaligenes hominis]HJH23927.1 ferredoxin [Paenalcaligenes hominis]
MYIVLTSKPGEYKTEPGPGTTVLSAYEYKFYDQTKAIFSIARIEPDSRVIITEEGEGGTVNNIPTRQMEKFDTEQEALKELEGLTKFGSIKAELVPCQI